MCSGDIMFKQSTETTQGRVSGLTAEPYIKEHQLTKNDEFLIVACDGVWDVYEYQDAGKYININNEKKKIDEICFLINFVFFS
jgi:protein phosphatase 2C family protein 2/3